MHNFKVGDEARLVYTRQNGGGIWRKGIIVTIISVEGGTNIDPYDYIVEFDLGRNTASVLKEQLEPIVEDDVSWEKVEEILGWNPTKETVV